MIRLVSDQSHQIERATPIAFTFDGATVNAFEGETILAALMRAGYLHLRDAPVDASPRGAFCCMGICQECVVNIDGDSIESCREIVSNGLTVRSRKVKSDD